MQKKPPAAEKEADAVNRAKYDYIASMSHDLKTPLVAVVGIGEILKKELTDSKHLDLLKDLENASNTILSLVKGILGLTKPGSTQLDLIHEPFDLLKLIEGVVCTMAHQSLEKGVEVFISYPSSFSSLIISDSNAVRRIIINLLSNAIRLTDQGYILIKVEEECLNEQEAKLRIIVEDSGRGIPESPYTMNFETLNQAQSIDKNSYSGIGLSLFIVKQLVNGLGGHLSLDSLSGKGSKFICSIPFAYKTVKKTLSTFKQNFSSLKILFINDQLAKKQILAEYLSEAITQFCSSQEAIKLLKSAYAAHDPFQLVLMDDKLITTDALNLAREIKLDQELKDLALVYISFPLNLLQKDQAKKAGFYQLIEKPILPSHFTEELASTWEFYALENAPLEDAARKQLPTATTESCPMQLGESAQLNLLHVLLVEDNVVAQRITRIILEKLGFQVDLAKTGKEALHYNESYHYDMIFLDIDLPDIDGVTICRIIRGEVGKNQHIPIIALSGQVVEKEKTVCLAAGMNEFMEKPALTADFIRVMNQYLGYQAKSLSE